MTRYLTLFLFALSISWVAHASPEFTCEIASARITPVEELKNEYDRIYVEQCRGLDLPSRYIVVFRKGAAGQLITVDITHPVFFGNSFFTDILGAYKVNPRTGKFHYMGQWNGSSNQKTLQVDRESFEHKAKMIIRSGQAEHAVLISADLDCDSGL